MKRFGLLTALALGLVGFAGSAKADLVIDTFSSASPNTSDPTIQITSGSSNLTQTGFATTDVIGGTRNLTLTINSNPLGANATDRIFRSASLFTISNDTLVDSTSVLLYNANGAGLGGLNLTSFGDKFAFNILAVDLNVSITIDLIDTSNNTKTLTRSSLTAGTANFNFGSFTGTGLLTAVNSIKVTFNTPNSADLTGSFLRVTGTPVPEPSSVVALGMGALLMGGVAVRRRRAAKA